VVGLLQIYNLNKSPIDEQYEKVIEIVLETLANIFHTSTELSFGVKLFTNFILKMNIVKKKLEETENNMNENKFEDIFNTIKEIVNKLNKK